MNYTVLGIESSCDEVAAAVYTTDKKLLSSTLFSQIEMHKKYGGVVPEIASREHIKKINSITQKALDEAGITLDDVDVIAVTSKPGLPGSLLIGTCFAKALAVSKNKKIIAINHLEGHAFSANIEHDIPFPFLCMTASGGHTNMYRVTDFGKYEVLGTTLDDAAGEAFDKISKLLRLGYPGGPIIEKLARESGFKDFYKYPRNKNIGLNFSFSGLKTAVMYDLVKKNAYDMKKKELLNTSEQLKKEVASSFQVCVADIFVQKVERALDQHDDYKALVFVGGVACNNYIRQRLTDVATKHNLPYFSPSPKYCTDNAAMIAYVGHYKAQKGEFSDPDFDIL
ncbi:MAG: N6-L-threonylcarbamoyladenine synthase [Alteromonas naphthalenivorans]|jgi:N6-L-threonylcarbamoyladenine synthase